MSTQFQGRLFHMRIPSASCSPAILLHTMVGLMEQLYRAITCETEAVKNHGVAALVAVLNYKQNPGMQVSTNALALLQFVKKTVSSFTDVVVNNTSCVFSHALEA